jgi:hypothetical protein
MNLLCTQFMFNVNIFLHNAVQVLLNPLLTYWLLAVWPTVMLWQPLYDCLSNS